MSQIDERPARRRIPPSKRVPATRLLVARVATWSAVAAATLAGVIAIRMASGGDPALGQQQVPTSASTVSGAGGVSSGDPAGGVSGGESDAAVASGSTSSGSTSSGSTSSGSTSSLDADSSFQSEAQSELPAVTSRVS